MFLATVRHIIDDLFIYTCVMFLATRLSQMFRDHHVCLHRTVAVCTQGTSGSSLNFLVTLALLISSHNATEPYRKRYGSTHCTMEPAMRARTMERDMPQMQGRPTKKGMRSVQRMQETISLGGGKLEGLVFLARWLSPLQNSWLLDGYDAEGKQKVLQTF